MSKTQHALENLHEHNSQGCGHDHHVPGMQMTVNVSSAIHMRNIAMFVVKAWKIVSAECLMLIV